MIVFLVVYVVAFPVQLMTLFNSFTPDSAKSKNDKFSKITNWVKKKNLKVKQHQSKVLFNSLPMKGPYYPYCS